MPTKMAVHAADNRLMTLRFGAGAATRVISRELGIWHSTVREYLARIAAAGITWPLPAACRTHRSGVAGACAVRQRRCAGRSTPLRGTGLGDGCTGAEAPRGQPDDPGKEIGLFTLTAMPTADTASCSWEFERRLSPSMRQTHVAGDKAFVDFSGKKILISDPATGMVREAEIFVGVLGASNLTYAEATWTQGLPDWIGAHVRMFRFWGARPRLLVPDNLKSGVHKASFYDPEVNRSYGAMAAHYGVRILASRGSFPRSFPHERTILPNRRPADPTGQRDRRRQGLPVSLLAEVIRVITDEGADPYLVIGVLVEGAVHTVAKHIPAERQVQVTEEVGRLLAERLKAVWHERSRPPQRGRCLLLWAIVHELTVVTGQ